MYGDIEIAEAAGATQENDVPLNSVGMDVAACAPHTNTKNVV